ncbi:MAG: cell division protein FtsI, partial [Clostridium sp.]
MKEEKKINRFNVLLVIMFAIFSLVISRLYYIQVLNGQYYKNIVKATAHNIVTVEAPRGLITDKNGIGLATEVPGYNLIYTDTAETGTQIFRTLQKVFKIFDENGEVQSDNFPLKIEPYRFEFGSNDPRGIEILKLRFLKDRGLQGNILKTKFKNKRENDLTSVETTQLDTELLKLTPGHIYNKLLKAYGVIEGVSSLNLQKTPAEIRRYLIVKDDIKMNFFSAYKSINIATNIKKDTSFIFEQSLSELPGIKVESKPMRQYPYGELASSVLGYISKISPTEKEKYTAMGYDISKDYVGITGIEASLERNLKGDNGGVDAKNGISSKEVTPGNNVQLTIDSSLQYATENALNSEMKLLQSKGTVKDLNVSNATRGAAVVIDIHTG